MAFYAGAFQPTSVALVAKKLGAIDAGRRTRGRFATADTAEAAAEVWQTVVAEESTATAEAVQEDEAEGQKSPGASCFRAWFRAPSAPSIPEDEATTNARLGPSFFDGIGANSPPGPSFSRPRLPATFTSKRGSSHGSPASCSSVKWQNTVHRTTAARSEAPSSSMQRSGGLMSTQL